MTLSECYRLLGLNAGASADEVKTSYRRLVRRYHPDVNPNNQEWAKQKFIELTHAYQSLTDTLSSATAKTSTQFNSSSPVPRHSPPQADQPPSPQSQSSSPPPPIQIRPNPALSDIDNQLKKSSYRQLQELLRNKRFARAIALVEGLVQRIPTDQEAKQWQAIAYQQYARHFTNEHQYAKAKIYLKKALRVDPNNRKLWSDIKEELNRLDQTLSQRRV
ncbi:MAG: J domain-containing protein [Cyanobacteria bacterium P01_A01_bin.37]